MLRIIIILFTVNCILSQNVGLINIDQIQNLMQKYMLNNLNYIEKEKFENVVEILEMPRYISRSTDNSFTSNIRQMLTCVACRAAFKSAFGLARLGVSDSWIIEASIRICQMLRIQTEVVCRGFLQQHMPIILYIFKNNREASSDTFCGLLLQSANKDSCTFDDPRFEWTIEIPPKPKNAPKIPLQMKYSKTMNILVISDAHIDPKYRPNTVAKCKEPLCCREQSTMSLRQNIFDDNFIDYDFLYENTIVKNGSELWINLNTAKFIRNMKSQKLDTMFDERDEMSHVNEKAGFWGDYRSCDMPMWTFESMLNHITRQHDFEMIYYLGDSVDHGVWETSKPLVYFINEYISNSFEYKFSNISFYPAVGNHESCPINQFAPKYVTATNYSTQWLYDNLAEVWSPWLSNEALASVRENGYYTMLVQPGLRLVVLNSNIAYRINWWLNYDPKYPARQLEWLVKTLLAAETADEKVHIISHIPPGMEDFIKTWTREYAKIVNRFSSTISAEFNGHTHNDEFKVFYSEHDDSPSAIAWNAGSLTPYYDFNMNYKIFSVNTDTYEPADIETWTFNLTSANLTPNKEPMWFLEYSFREHYNLSNLSPASMNNLIQRMAQSEKPLLKDYVKFLGKSGDAHLQKECNKSCHFEYLCNTVVTELWETSKCDQLELLYGQS